jgi:hypothetical protein
MSQAASAAGTEVQRVAIDFDRLQRERRQGRELWPFGCHVDRGLMQSSLLGIPYFVDWLSNEGHMTPGQFRDVTSLERPISRLDGERFKIGIMPECAADSALFSSSLANVYDLSDAPCTAARGPPT